MRKSARVMMWPVTPASENVTHTHTHNHPVISDHVSSQALTCHETHLNWAQVLRKKREGEKEGGRERKREKERERERKRERETKREREREREADR